MAGDEYCAGVDHCCNLIPTDTEGCKIIFCFGGCQTQYVNDLWQTQYFVGRATPVTSSMVKSEARCSRARRVQAPGQIHLALKLQEAALALIERHCTRPAISGRFV